MRRYLPASTGIGETFRLSDAEQAWLRSHGPVRMGYDQAFTAQATPTPTTRPKAVRSTLSTCCATRPG